MAKEVLLMADVPGLGSEGDVVRVADGYARNCLLPKKVAAEVTDATRKRLEKMRKEREAASKAEIAAARQLAETIEKISCTIPVKVGKDEKLYGSVTAADVGEALKAQGVEEIDKHEILLDKPIKELGVFNVTVRVHPEVEALVKVWVVEE